MRVWPILLLLAALALALLLSACEKPDASDVTSPSAKSLLGTTTGTVAFTGDPPPAPISDPEGWDVRFENARFAELENDQHSIQVVLQVQSRPGPPMQVWLTSAGETVLYWAGGSARSYNGVVCFQFRLEEEGEAVPLGPGPHEMTIAFGNPGVEDPLVVKTQRVAGTVPTLDGGIPGPESRVGEELLGCPRSVI